MMLLVASGIGIAFYILGGMLGERFGRQRVLITSAVSLAVLLLLLLRQENLGHLAPVHPSLPSEQRHLVGCRVCLLGGELPHPCPWDGYWMVGCDVRTGSSCQGAVALLKMPASAGDDLSA